MYKKYQKAHIIEVILVLENGSYLVQNEGDPSYPWIMSKEEFEMNYQEVPEMA